MKSNANNEHKRKIRMARKMMTSDEVKSGTPIFQSIAWKERAKAKQFQEIKKVKRGIIKR